jgi:hypothetical protein
MQEMNHLDARAHVASFCAAHSKLEAAAGSGTTNKDEKSPRTCRRKNRTFFSVGFSAATCSLKLRRIAASVSSKSRGRWPGRPRSLRFQRRSSPLRSRRRGRRALPRRLGRRGRSGRRRTSSAEVTVYEAHRILHDSAGETARVQQSTNILDPVERVPASGEGLRCAAVLVRAKPGEFSGF